MPSFCLSVQLVRSSHFNVFAWNFTNENRRHMTMFIMDYDLDELFFLSFFFIIYLLYITLFIFFSKDSPLCYFFFSRTHGTVWKLHSWIFIGFWQRSFLESCHCFIRNHFQGMFASFLFISPQYFLFFKQTIIWRYSARGSQSSCTHIWYSV